MSGGNPWLKPVGVKAPGLLWSVDGVEETNPRTCMDCPKHRQEILQGKWFGCVLKSEQHLDRQYGHHGRPEGCLGETQPQWSQAQASFGRKKTS